MNTASILAAFADQRVLIVGDVCLDRWCTYDPAYTEPSRETGLPRTAVVRTVVTPGAAGTVANNLAALGVRRIAVLGVIGEDGHGYELLGALRERGIGSDLLVQSTLVPTFTYTKLINRETDIEDLPRVDYIYPELLPTELEEKLVERLRQVAADFDVILVSDQAETDAGGVVTPRLREALAEIAASHPQRVIWVDSRLRAHEFRRVLVKINDREAELASRSALGKLDYAGLRRHLDSPLLVVTHGSRGALVVDGQGERWVATKPVAQPVDICGAGDSFTAGAALAYAVTRSPEQAARIGNLVASVTIMKPGTGTATPAEVLAAESAFA